ncbi:iron-containing alcohol dehydrogenase family protein [Cloacibacillus sp. An23]|uniref:iron-containing alcohol dehydrogenase family protein n=1 Tax=Cloacibacillus sp. An23 TaxID=1965591 RepID=UPI000B381EBA|nr:iron-containing alcohol dehydrogenase family protein [Cloacibacillus sp. An23]OUO91578.1 glycerol-1-phosphate dehydrogenase [Cloacibacillus sp. An23]
MLRDSNSLKISAGNITHVADMLVSNQCKGKILYVSDFVVDNLFGDVVKEQLKDLDSVAEELVDNNTISYAMAIAENVIISEIKCIVGLGGGKVLDVCKYAAYIAKVPLLSIPTTMANDGIASPIAVLKGKDNKPKSLGCAVPSMLLLDTDLILSSPVSLIKAGIGDTISNYTALIDWDFACSRYMDDMNGYAYLMSKTSLDIMMKTQYNSICPDFINVLANSLVLSGIAMNFAGSSRPVSGSEHLFSHALDYYGTVRNLHGIQVALGTIAVLKIIGLDYSNVAEYLSKFDVCINPRKLEIDQSTFIHCLQNATKMRKNRYTHLNEADLSTQRLEKIYHELEREL